MGVSKMLPILFTQVYLTVTLPHHGGGKVKDVADSSSDLPAISSDLPDVSVVHSAPGSRPYYPDDGSRGVTFVHEGTGPSSALPKLVNSNYTDKGEVVNLGDLPIYVVGAGERGIVWNYDIMGFDAGRTRQLCDYFADQGYMVVLPDYFRGEEAPAFTDPAVFTFLAKVSNWTSLQSDWGKVKEFMVEKGVNSFGAIGTCWGSYPTIRLSTLPEFKAGVSMHPSHSTIMPAVGDNEGDIYGQVKSPQLIMPSRTDSENVKVGGLAEQTLGDKATIIEFPEMDHGWTTRGNLSVPAVDRDVHLALSEAINCFNNVM